MPKAYVILTEDIKDTDGMSEYEKASAPALRESGARVLAADPDPQVLEGQWHGQRTVILEFQSADAALAWYRSDSYQQAVGLRHAAADTHAAIIAGFQLPTAASDSR